MTEFEPKSGDVIKCHKCGAVIYPDDEFCTSCGAAKPEPESPATAPINNWFSQAGSLDDSLDDSYKPSDPVPGASKPIPKASVGSCDTGSAGSAFIKPVKGVDDKPVNTVTHNPEPSRTEHTPVITSASADPTKEVTRCIKCGAAVPKGTTLCWKCSTSERSAEKTDTVKKSPDTHPVEKSVSFFTVKNILKIISIICLVLVFMPSFLVSCSGQTYQVRVVDVVSGKFDDYMAYAGSSVNKAHPSLYLFFIIPVAVVVLLFIKRMVNNLKAIVISGAIAVDLFCWYRFYSQAKTLSAQYYCTFETTVWFTLNIVLLVIIFVASILTLLHVFEFDTDIVSKIKKPEKKNE